jgi:MoxR-like ATPase
MAKQPEQASAFQTPEEIAIEKSRAIFERYQAPPGLQYAIEGALALDQPLLLTGEPGTGKTTLADYAVHYLRGENDDFYPLPLQFHTKTSSRASDLFYTYDALSHFQAANLRDGKTADTANYITLQALGQAIAMSRGKQDSAVPFLASLPDRYRSSVVLIDEVDKAPRDFTNDILDEIERYRFRIRELSENNTFEKKPDAKILVILTSNSEKNLPEAFLRRCAFYHIGFPDKDSLRKIVQSHIGQISDAASTAYDELIGFFLDARENAVRKKPATAELIAWLRLLGMREYFTKNKEEQKQLLLHNLSFLVKTQEDLEAIRKLKQLS